VNVFVFVQVSCAVLILLNCCSPPGLILCCVRTAVLAYAVFSGLK
jgi:hypothetical protein